MRGTKCTYDDDKIACLFYLKHKDKSYKKIDMLVAALGNKFPKTSVILKLKNFEYLHTSGKSGMANSNYQSRYVYRHFAPKKSLKAASKARTHDSDVANAAARNILTLVSIYKGEITDAEMLDTCRFFGHKCPTTGDEVFLCPYTGKDITAAVKNKMAGIPDTRIDLDHIVPQNRDFCGLNTYGNVIWVDAAANRHKGGRMDYKTFLLTDKDIAATSTPAEIQARIDKIEAFQKHSGYDATSLARIISPLIKKHYTDIQSLQHNAATEIAKKAKI